MIKISLILSVFLFGILSKMAYHLRSPLARALFDKIQYQNDHLHSNHSEWYSVQERYLSSGVMERCVQMFQDEETGLFLETCFEKSDWIFTQIYQGLVKTLLSFFISSTSANGLLNRGSMFVLSTSQFKQLIGIGDNTRLERLLDLGAGDGKITAKFQPFFDEVFATEVSSTMRWRLTQRNIKVLDVDTWQDQPAPFDVISCLNLLDRCDRPLTTLQLIKSKLRPVTGLLLVALVFPMRQYVEGSSDHRPQEVLELAATKIWEVQFNHFVKEVVEPAGFELLRWTRVPYLCEGDFSRSFYYLNDVVLVLRPV